MNRQQRAQEAQHTLTILKQKGYHAPSGKQVDLAQALDMMRRGRQEYSPSVALPELGEAKWLACSTTIVVEHATTLASARELVAKGLDTAVLNFASAYHPGGGFSRGASAQEEYLARMSGMYEGLHDAKMYKDHKGNRDPFYTNYAVYTPGVPVFRDEDAVLLEEPWCVGMLTAPAVNAGVVLARDWTRQDEVDAEMLIRIEKVLTLLAYHGHEAVVLGAWGCGVFGNKPERIATLFKHAFEGDFAGRFQEVRFAIFDRSSNQKIIKPFEKAFASS